MEKRLQIFISSTYSDLKSERQAAVEAILRARHIPAGMELFAAGDISQLQVISRWIKESDIFMLILGGRYGTIEPNSGKSYTQLEYEFALANDIPVFAVVLTEAFLEEKMRAQGKAVFELTSPDKYKAFKNAVLTKICRLCEDSRDIKLAVFETLIYFANDAFYSFGGWVPGGSLADAEQVRREHADLKKENSVLMKAIAEIGQLRHPGDFFNSLMSTQQPKSPLDATSLDALDRSGLRSAFRIRVNNPAREQRVEELVTEELLAPKKKHFRLLASSGSNYLSPQGKVWESGLGEAIVNGAAELTVLLESPFSSFSRTRALANGVSHHHWQEKTSASRLEELDQYDNVTIRITDHAVNCSLFFTSTAVFYDPYLWARPSPARRTENNFWVFEFRKHEEPDDEYECYTLLERHFDFLLSTGISLNDLLGENNAGYNEKTELFRKAMKLELQQPYGL